MPLDPRHPLAMRRCTLLFLMTVLLVSCAPLQRTSQSGTPAPAPTVEQLNPMPLPPSVGEVPSAVVEENIVVEEDEGTPNDEEEREEERTEEEGIAGTAGAPAPSVNVVPVERGSYVEKYYPDGADVLATEVIGKGKRAVLFFYAAWCPFCQQKEAILRRLYSSEKFQVSTYKVNYDASLTLRDRYAVVTQDTLVLIDGWGNMLQSRTGGSEFDVRSILSSP